MANYFLSDPHLAHSKLCRDCRPEYRNTREMDADIIDTCNRTALRGDLLYVVGDFAWRRFDYYAAQIRATMILVRGNHDPGWSKCRKHFQSVHDIIYGRKIDGQSVTICHYPLLFWPGKYMVCGHIHTGLPRKPRRLSCTWDRWHRPVTLAEMIARDR